MNNMKKLKLKLIKKFISFSSIRRHNEYPSTYIICRIKKNNNKEEQYYDSVIDKFHSNLKDATKYGDYKHVVEVFKTTRCYDSNATNYIREFNYLSWKIKVN